MPRSASRGPQTALGLQPVRHTGPTFEHPSPLTCGMPGSPAHSSCGLGLPRGEGQMSREPSSAGNSGPMALTCELPASDPVLGCPSRAGRPDPRPAQPPRRPQRQTVSRERRVNFCLAKIGGPLSLLGTPTRARRGPDRVASLHLCSASVSLSLVMVGRRRSAFQGYRRRHLADSTIEGSVAVEGICTLEAADVSFAHPRPPGEWVARKGGSVNLDRSRVASICTSPEPPSRSNG